MGTIFLFQLACTYGNFLILLYSLFNFQVKDEIVFNDIKIPINILDCQLLELFKYKNSFILLSLKNSLKYKIKTVGILLKKIKKAFIIFLIFKNIKLFVYFKFKITLKNTLQVIIHINNKDINLNEIQILFFLIFPSSLLRKISSNV